MEKIVSKEEAKKFMEIPGEVKGLFLMTKADYIQKDQGEEGVKKLEQAMVDFDYPLKYKEIKSTSFYPLGLFMFHFTALHRLFGYDEKRFSEMGKAEAKNSSPLIRIFLSHFASLERLAQVVPKMWRDQFSIGSLKAVKIDKSGKQFIVRLNDFTGDPYMCSSLMGYFSGILSMVVGKAVSCEEVKCVHRGDSHHDFLLKW
ncbi:MAG: 4-vinyl reductase [bacterium]|nr:4-vinyl reductase [bacterium]